MAPSQKLVVSEQDPPCRIDAFLHLKFPEYSRTYFQYLIEEGYVTINGHTIKKREPPALGDLIEILFHPKDSSDLSPQEMPLAILYEDESLLAINKPRGLVVHPAPGHPSNTLVNGLLYRYHAFQVLDTLRPGIVHRLDKNTSGILLIAKTQKALEALSLAFKERRIHKEYLALCIGDPGVKTLQNQLGRDPRHRQRMAIVQEGKEAISYIQTLEYKKGYSLVKILPSTGRTHQIRVHLQSLGCPVLGDPLYGHLRINERLKLSGQMLHAHTLHFKHPLCDQDMVLTAELPPDMQELKKRLF